MDGTSRCCIYWEIVNLQEKKANPDGEYQDPIKKPKGNNVFVSICIRFSMFFPCFPFQSTSGRSLRWNVPPSHEPGDGGGLQDRDVPHWDGRVRRAWAASCSDGTAG